MNFPTQWSVNQVGAMPVIEVVGESNYKSSELFMIRIALRIIEIAHKYDGILLPEWTECECRFEITLSFSIIFKSLLEMQKFVLDIQENLEY